MLFNWSSAGVCR